MNDDDFRTTIISYGLVIRVPFKNLDALKEKIAGVEGVKVVYQKATTSRLKIIEDLEPEKH